jgi:GxxExxY protein
MGGLPRQEQPNAERAEASQRAQRFSGSDLSGAVIGCAIEVQRHLGTGLLESAYSAALAVELESRNIAHRREVAVLATYKGRPLGIGYRADFIVEDFLVIEVKAIEALNGTHKAQLLSYLRVGGFPLGLLVNFHAAPLATRGTMRVVNQLA